MSGDPSTTTLRNVQKELAEYRRKHEEKLKLARQKEEEEEKRLAEEREKKMNPKSNLRFFQLWAIDVLDILPLRLWRKFNAKYPLQCWVVTLSFWLIGQLLAAHIEFGCVYFLFSLFLLMFLNLGVRAEGELSAYSVFNPNCHRLLGQITSEHFERDMLMQAREDDE
ncbi:unnamed protein product [Bursaphelenchus okinawaensis]|uniref:SAYSvFN domain-containing protein n=1 Tax=Bursaphelenchus okinawaensis TaxID=465554 RepID=A0A811KP17_9BILA|nr:unnamed protein product [Bursaphelenchus okinawaensis]CAG9106241.1 unnamed protein product [Bursaphelenchus okinawaensis]